MRLSAQLRAGEEWRRVAITDVTTTGLRCECPDPPGAGASVEIRFQGFSIAGSVQWTEACEFGVACSDTVDVELLVAGSPEVDIGRRALPRLEVRLPASLTVGEVEVPVVFMDISPSGARLSLRSPPPRGARGTIAWEGIASPCTVVWSTDSQCGVAFGEDFELSPETAGDARASCDDLPDPVPVDEETGEKPQTLVYRDRPDRRGAGRVAVNWSCEVHHVDSRRVQVPLTNISTEGCEIGWFAGCRTDVPLYIRMPNLSTVKAHVEWKDGYRIGCRFSKPLNRFVLEYLIGNAVT